MLGFFKSSENTFSGCIDVQRNDKIVDNMIKINRNEEIMVVVPRKQCNLAERETYLTNYR